MILSTNYCYLHCIFLIHILPSGITSFLKLDCIRKSTVHIKLRTHFPHQSLCFLCLISFASLAKKGMQPYHFKTRATKTFEESLSNTPCISLSCTLSLILRHTVRISITHSLGIWWNGKQEGKVTPCLLCLLLLSFQKTGMASLLPRDSEHVNGCIPYIKMQLETFFFFFFLLTIACETSELFLPFIIIFGHYLNILINVRNRSCDSALAVARKKCSAAELQSGLKCLFMYLHEERRPDRFFLSIWLPVSLLIWTEAFCIWLPLACFISLLHCPVL